MIVLKCTGEHYIFYKQTRVGRYGKDFELFKFATMLKDSPNLDGGLFTTKNDPRILPIGKFLRKTKINELPQLINILLGQMSIVGYRPLVRQSYEEYSNEIKQKLYNVKPGLSGIGSIVLRNEEEIIQEIDDKENFYKDVIIPYKGRLESWFTNNFTLSVYFKIIFVTVLVVFKPLSYIGGKVFKNLPPIPEELKIYL
jgi:lipopolysaccharide/colanic/teichoic acid biosynthesis glycosyltransferase